MKPERRSDDALSGSFHQAIRSFKRELVRSALRKHSGNKLRAARELRISRCYLHRLLNQFDIQDTARAEEEEEETIQSEGAGACVAAGELRSVPRGK